MRFRKVFIWLSVLLLLYGHALIAEEEELSAEELEIIEHLDFLDDFEFFAEDLPFIDDDIIFDNSQEIGVEDE